MDLIKKLLVRDPKKRLGHRGAAQVKVFLSLSPLPGSLPPSLTSPLPPSLPPSLPPLPPSPSSSLPHPNSLSLSPSLPLSLSLPPSLPLSFPPSLPPSLSLSFSCSYIPIYNGQAHAWFAGVVWDKIYKEEPNFVPAFEVFRVEEALGL